MCDTKDFEGKDAGTPGVRAGHCHTAAVHTDLLHLGHDGVVAVVADMGGDPHPVTPPVILADQVNLDTLHISSKLAN